MNPASFDITKIPPEVAALWTLYLREDFEFWRCSNCGGRYPYNVAPNCIICTSPIMLIPDQ